MSRKVLRISLLSSAILFCVLSVEMESAENGANLTAKPSFETYRGSSIDRTWVTPIGVVGHHRTFGVTYSGNLGDLPESQWECFHFSKVRPWVSGLEGVFPDATGLAVGKPTNFWGIPGKLQQRLLEGNLPVVISQGNYGDLHLEQTAFATLPGGEIVSHQGDEPLLAYVRVRVKNLAGTGREPVIWVWRSGPLPELGEIGGLTRRFEAVKLVGSKVVADSGHCHLIFFPRRWELTSDSSADSKDLRYFGRLSTKLGPGETKDFWYIYPYWPLSKDLADRVGQEEYDEMLVRVTSNWKRLYSQGMTVSVPDEKIGQAFSIGLANTLLLSQRVPWGLLLFDSESFRSNMKPIDFYGTIRLGHYNLMCEDSAQKAIVHSLLETGHFEYARDALESIFHAQSISQPRGAFGQEGNLSSGNATVVGERGCACVWMSGTGYSLWAAVQYYRYTHDADWIRKHREKIVSALEWIKAERHRPDFFAGYDGLVRGMRVCDSADASYSPYNDVVSYWGMKEMVGVLVSLGLAGKDWEQEVRDYEEKIKTVYEKSDLSAYFGKEGDYGLTAGAAIMSGLYSLDSPVGRKLADGPRAGWYGMYHGLFRIEEGEREKFLEQYYELISNHMSHFTHTNGEWPVPDCAGALPDTPCDKNRSVINVQPHSHSDAGFHFMTRAMLVYEDDASIHLLRGIPSWWLTQTDKSIDVRQAPTISGQITLTLSRLRDQIRVLIDLSKAAPDRTIRVYLPLPAGSHLTRVEINGKPWKELDSVNNVVSFSGLSGRVDLLAFLK